MPDPAEPPKSIEPVLASPPPRSWQRSAFFKVNIVFGLLSIHSCWFAFAISRDILTLSVAIAVTIYVVCEGAGLFTRSLMLERGLGFADTAIALGMSVFAAANITHLNPPDAGPGNIVFCLCSD